MGFDRCVQADCPITVPYGPSASTQNQALAVHMFLFAAVLGKENTYLPACSRLFVIILRTTCCSLAVGKSTHIFINVKSHIVGEKKKPPKNKTSKGFWTSQASHRIMLCCLGFADKNDTKNVSVSLLMRSHYSNNAITLSVSSHHSASQFHMASATICTWLQSVAVLEMWQDYI